MSASQYRSRPAAPPARRGGKVYPGAARLRQSIGDELGPSQIQPKRYRNKPKECIYSITTGDIRRLARRGGVKRIQKDIYTETRQVLRKFVEEVRSLYSAPLIAAFARLLARYGTEEEANCNCA